MQTARIATKVEVNVANMREQHLALWTVASTAAEAVEMIHTQPIWDKSLSKFAAI